MQVEVVKYLNNFDAVIQLMAAIFLGVTGIKFFRESFLSEEEEVKKMHEERVKALRIMPNFKAIYRPHKLNLYKYVYVASENSPV